MACALQDQLARVDKRLIDANAKYECQTPPPLAGKGRKATSSIRDRGCLVNRSFELFISFLINTIFPKWTNCLFGTRMSTVDFNFQMAKVDVIGAGMMGETRMDTREKQKSVSIMVSDHDP